MTGRHDAQTYHHHQRRQAYIHAKIEPIELLSTEWGWFAMQATYLGHAGWLKLDGLECERNLLTRRR